MKKLIALALVAFAAFGGTSFAAPGEACAGPVDAACTVENADGSTEDCVLFIDGVDAGVDGCYNESDLPA